MGLESATYIDDLVATNPAFNDIKGEGDDHIRLIKAVLKNTFPNLTGAVNLTEAELNALLTDYAALGHNTDILSLAAAVTLGNGGPLVGTRPVVQNVQSSNYTLVLADAGLHIFSENAGAQTLTVPANASVAFPIGTAITVVNNGTTEITFDTSAVTMYKAGFSTAWSSGGTLAVRGMATLLKVKTDTWFISGVGLSV